jgi:photosystem II stability/assembly factor-like uncharacterized protein
MRVLVGIAGESLSNRETTKLGTGLLFSDDLERGRWRDIVAGLPDAPEVRAIARSTGGVVYVGTQAGVHRSDDGGLTFRLLPAPTPGYGVWALAVHPADPDVVLAGYEPAAVYRSDDGGVTWARAAFDPVFPAATEKEPKRVMSLAFDLAAPDHVFGAVEIGGVIGSHDGGRSFAQLLRDASPDLADCHGVTVTKGRVIVATRIGVVASDDHGRTWTPSLSEHIHVTGIDATQLAAIVESISKEQFAANLVLESHEQAGDEVRFVLAARIPGRDDYGGNFDARGVGGRRNSEGRVGPAACWHALHATVAGLFRANPHARVRTAFVTFEGAHAFEQQTASLAKAAARGCDCASPTIVEDAALTREVLRVYFAQAYCRSIALGAVPGEVYVAAGEGYLAEHGTIYRTQDWGRTWTAQPVPADVGTGLFCVVAGSSPGEVLCASRGGQVCLTRDGGKSWTIIPTPAGKDPIYALAQL